MKKSDPKPKKQPSLPTTTSTLIRHPDLGFKLRALLYDFRNIASDHLSKNRISQTTDSLYISAPYFTPEEAILVKEAIVDNDGSIHQHPFYPGNEKDNNLKERRRVRGLTVERAIQTRLANLLDKNTASGDTLRYEPHEIVPIYEQVLGIHPVELRYENLWRRLQQSGLQTGPEFGNPFNVPKWVKEERKQRKQKK